MSGRPRLDPPPDVEAMLGVLADTEIGKRYGVPRQVVALWRRAAGKPPVPRAGRPPVPRPPRAAPKRHGRPRLACPDDVAPLLGVRPDDEVAARAGVSSATVRRWRTEREIEPCRERGRPRSAMTPPTTQRRPFRSRNRDEVAKVAAKCGRPFYAERDCVRVRVTP